MKKGYQETTIVEVWYRKNEMHGWDDKYIGGKIIEVIEMRVTKFDDRKHPIEVHGVFLVAMEWDEFEN